MFCRKCGSNIPDDSDFCQRCGTAVVSTAAASPHNATAEVLTQTKASPAAALLADTTRASPTATVALASDALHIPAELRSGTLPYRWGKFQGWVCLVVGIFAAAFSPIAIASKDERALEYAIVSPLLIASGYAFVRRRKYSVLMTYLWMGLYAIIFLAYLLDGVTNKSFTPAQQGEEIGKGVGTLIVGLAFWGLRLLPQPNARIHSSSCPVHASTVILWTAS